MFQFHEGIGGFLTTDSYSRTIGCRFSYCSLEIFVGDNILMEEDIAVMAVPSVPFPLGKPHISRSK